MKFSLFPLLQTERLLLRALTEGDKEAIYFMRSSEKVNEFIFRKKLEDVEEALTFITDINNKIVQQELIYWAISMKNNPELIGTICLWNFSADNLVAELGYEMNPAFQKLGLMTDAIRCVVNYGFEQLNLKRLEAFTNKNNMASIRLLEKNGFIFLPNRIDEDYPLNIVFELAKNVENTQAFG